MFCIELTRFFLFFTWIYSGNKDGFPVAKAFGSFSMDIFTSSSDLDLSINFSNDMIHFPRDKKISILRMLSKVLYAQQSK